jgi:hypothetical protein
MNHKQTKEIQLISTEKDITRFSVSSGKVVEVIGCDYTFEEKDYTTTNFTLKIFSAWS